MKLNKFGGYIERKGSRVKYYGTSHWDDLRVKTYHSQKNPKKRK